MRQWRGRADPTCLLDALTAALLSAGGICLALFLAGQGQSLGVCLALAAGQALLCLAAGRRRRSFPAARKTTPRRAPATRGSSSPG